MKKLIWLIVAAVLVVGFLMLARRGEELTDTAGAETTVDPAETELLAEVQDLFAPLPTVAESEATPLLPERVSLGKKLYFDARLSKDNTVSCDSCHSLAKFGVDNLPKSPGNDGQLGGRNSPTVLNAALHTAQFWDGRAADVEEQAGMPILNPVEMAIPSEEFLVDRLAEIPEYQEAFAAAFADEAESLTYRNIARALGAFERTLITPSRFDDYLNGDVAALSAEEKDGLRAFSELGCTSCHAGSTLGGYSFQKFGLLEDYWEHTRSEQVDEGRFEQSGVETDKYVFKVAGLRNIAKTGPYFHDGSVDSLEEAVRIMAKVQLGEDLEESKVAAVTAFLGSLTGEVPAGAMQTAASP